MDIYQLDSVQILVLEHGAKENNSSVHCVEITYWSAALVYDWRSLLNIWWVYFDYYVMQKLVLFNGNMLVKWFCGINICLLNVMKVL